MDVVFPNGLTIEVNQKPTDDEVMASCLIYITGFQQAMIKANVPKVQWLDRLLKEQMETSGLSEGTCRWYIDNTLEPKVTAFRALSDTRKEEIWNVARRMLKGDAPMRMSGAGRN
jgi:hypothetical protein